MKKAVLDGAMVARLPPARKGKRTYLHDDTVPGFGVAVTDKGTKTFFLYRKFAGVPKRVTLGHFPAMSVEAARQKAREYDVAKAGLESHEIGPSVLPRSRWRSVYLGVGALAATVCLIVLMFVGTGILNFWRSEAALQSLISFAIDDHLNHRDMTFRSTDPIALREALRQELPFAVEMPRIDPDFKVIGGRADKIGANSVAYTVWHGKNDNVYSLLQFRRVDFGVNPADRPELVAPEDMAVKHTPCQALYWSEGEYGFVLVANHGELLDGVKPETD
jgi:hypothetical protein